MTEQQMTAVPAHTNNRTGTFCTREGSMQPNGRCPDGCDHEAHYANDGHPECEDASTRLSLAEMSARARNSSLTDPSWRTDYRS